MTKISEFPPPNKFLLSSSILIKNWRVCQASALNSPLEKQGTRRRLVFFGFQSTKRIRWTKRWCECGILSTELSIRRTSAAFPLILEVVVNNQTTPEVPQKAQKINHKLASKKCQTVPPSKMLNFTTPQKTHLKKRDDVKALKVKWQAQGSKTKLGVLGLFKKECTGIFAIFRSKALVSDHDSSQAKEET